MRKPVPKAERMRRKESKTTPLYLVRGLVSDFDIAVYSYSVDYHRETG